MSREPMIALKKESRVYKLTVEAECMGDFYNARSFAERVLQIMKEHLKGRAELVNIQNITLDYHPKDEGK